MRFWLMPSAVVVGLFAWVAPHAVSGEADEPIVGIDPEDQKYLDAKAAEKDKILKERQRTYDALQAKMNELAKAREESQKLKTESVTIDGETKPVVEPKDMEDALGLPQGKKVRDPYEISPDDFVIAEHERWAINLSDFRIDQPQYISRDTRHGSEKNWFGFSFTLTNTSAKKRRITPQFTAVTNKGVFNQAVTGYIPERILADTLQRPLGQSEALRDKTLVADRVAPLESIVALTSFRFDPENGTAQYSTTSTFEPGQTRTGAALWSHFSNEFTELKVIVHGVTNSHRYEEKMRRVLVLTFERIDDEFNVHRTALKYKDKRWEYLWMWDQDITVPIPTDPKDPQIKVETLKTPAGADKLAFAFPFVVKNSTRAKQEFALNTISFALPVEIDVGGTKVPVEVKVVDDGRSTIYKSQLLKALGKDSKKDRFAGKGDTEGSKTATERRMHWIDPGAALDENMAVFDEADVDWDDVRLQVEAALTEKVDKKALAQANWETLVKSVAPDAKGLAEKNPGFVYDPRRRLTDDEFKTVKEQVQKGLPGALDAAKAKKTVSAYFNCTSGLSTGPYRISRSYRQPGVVDEAWLKEWEKVEKEIEEGN